MSELLLQHGSTIAVGIVVAVVIALSAYTTYKDSKTSPCGGNCSGCSTGETSYCNTKKIGR